MNYTLNTGAGDSFHTVSKTASNVAIQHDCTVEFDFNGIKCLVNKETNTEWLYRDYANAWEMEWKEVGPNCVEEYSEEVQLELTKRNKIAEDKAAEQTRLYKIKEDKERGDFNEKVKGVEIVLKSKEEWESGKAKNTDSYGACIYEYAEGWAKLMQVEIGNGKKIKDIAEKTSHELGFLGITGFMYGAAVSVLSHCWEHGEELRKWHNKEYNHEGEGVVNPAVLSISV